MSETQKQFLLKSKDVDSDFSVIQAYSTYPTVDLLFREIKEYQAVSEAEIIAQGLFDYGFHDVNDMSNTQYEIEQI